jgi:uncharacterized membrane protein
MRSKNPRKFLTPEELAEVGAAVAQAEFQTSAELRLVIVRHCLGSLERKAARVFREFGLHKTAGRNGVLILLVTTNREFLIHGGEGIHERVGQAFWEDVRDRLAERFRNGDFAGGLCEAIRTVGGRLAEHFPRRADDRNEVPDEVGYEG